MPELGLTMQIQLPMSTDTSAVATLASRRANANLNRVGLIKEQTARYRDSA